jgi:hypothetical protein
VSAYVTAFHRPARKPFNPILGETFEWVREDKGFKFVAEQVSHHPPIAACHCESPNFTFWQDARIKSKFWGKSMEVFPVGTVNVTIPKHGDHYEWEKVTSCIHNVLGGQRWVDQYGQMTITNNGKCSCKLTFVKASYWSSRKYEVHGDVFDGEGERVRHLFGTWHQAMFCGEEEGEATCIWQAASMPADSDQYYGFNQFAIQLNGFEEGMREKLPQTDSRFRPDQRLMEEGYIEQAEQEKHRVEQIQRQARAERERVGEDWSPTFFRKERRKGEECWVSHGNYWTHRETGFQDLPLPRLW